MDKLYSLALKLCLKPGNFNFMGQLFKKRNLDQNDVDLELQ